MSFFKYICRGFACNGFDILASPFLLLTSILGLITLRSCYEGDAISSVIASLYAILLCVWIIEVLGLLYTSYEIYLCEKDNVVNAVNCKIENEDFNVWVPIIFMCG